jgi:hypothetical protein
MESKVKRKYNSIYRNVIKEKIKKIRFKNDFVYIYNLISDELQDNISINRNGIYFNLNILSDDTIEKLNLFLNEKIKNIDNNKISL